MVPLYSIKVKLVKRKLISIIFFYFITIIILIILLVSSVFFTRKSQPVQYFSVRVFLRLTTLLMVTV